MILSSLIEPTTLTDTSAFLASYSATTFLNSFSSRALQPTQIVRFVTVARSLAAGEPAAPIAAASTRPTRATTIAALRLIGTSSLDGRN